MRFAVCGAVVAMAGCGASERFERGSPTGGALLSTVVEHHVEPIFDDVTELTPTRLAEGWQRCSAGPSTLDDAGADWWSQTFGPAGASGCRGLVTVTQVPPEVDYYGDADAEVITRPPPWLRRVALVDEDTGARGCSCGRSARTSSSRPAVSPPPPPNCSTSPNTPTRGRVLTSPPAAPGEESDLAREETLTQVFGADARMYTIDGCPLRLDIAALATAPEDDHCYPGVRSLNIGTPLGASTTASTACHYYRDPEDLLNRPAVRQRLDLDAELPAGAVDTGHRQGDFQLWIDPADDTLIYVVLGDVVEAWPRVDDEVVCA